MAFPSSDAEFFGLVPAAAPGEFHFTVRNHLARLDRHLYGGTAIGVSICAVETLTGNHAQWMTTQFVATAPPDADITVVAEVLAPGRQTQQVRVTGLDAHGTVMFASLGATGRALTDGIHGVFENPPRVTPPEDSAAVRGPFDLIARAIGLTTQLTEIPASVGFVSVLEFRAPDILEHPDPGPGRLCAWVRRRDGVPLSPALLSFVADMVPVSVAAASETMAFGTSLDNTIRIGEQEPTEWALVDLRPHLAGGAYAHGAAHLWSETGHLLATASQSAILRVMDEAAVAAFRAHLAAGGPD
jgi:acyl-CoA thioesterase